MRFLVLTSLVLTAATAAAGAQPAGPCQLDDRAPATIAGGADDQDHDRRPTALPPVALTGSVPVLPPNAAAAPADLIQVADAPPPASVIPFAPKTSPPRARWF